MVFLEVRFCLLFVEEASSPWFLPCAMVGRLKSRHPKSHTCRSADWMIRGRVQRGVSLSECVFEDGFLSSQWC